jgi:hypothetical protein
MVSARTGRATALRAAPVALVLAAALALAAPTAAPAKTFKTGHGGATQLRFGGGRGFGSRGLGTRRTTYPRRTAYPRLRTRGLGRSILRGLGIAFLLHALFGYGAGGSPIGLLLVFAFILWLVSRRRRRGRFAY